MSSMHSLIPHSVQMPLLCQAKKNWDNEGNKGSIEQSIKEYNVGRNSPCSFKHFNNTKLKDTVNCINSTALFLAKLPWITQIRSFWGEGSKHVCLDVACDALGFQTLSYVDYGRYFNLPHTGLFKWDCLNQSTKNAACEWWNGSMRPVWTNTWLYRLVLKMFTVTTDRFKGNFLWKLI